MDFKDSLKDIKKELLKEQDEKAKQKPENSQNEFEDLVLKEERLRNEFLDFIQNSDIKKIK